MLWDVYWHHIWISNRKKYKIMITWLVISLVLAFVFGLLGFTKISKAFGGIAKILFYICIVFFVIALVFQVFS